MPSSGCGLEQYEMLPASWIPKLLNTLREYWRRMKPKTFLFPGTVKNWRADVPIMEKIVWEAVAHAAEHAGIKKHVSPHTLSALGHFYLKRRLNLGWERYGKLRGWQAGDRDQFFGVSEAF